MLLLISLACIFVGDKSCWSASSITARENLDILIKTNSCRDCDLSGLNLNRMDLSGADLEGADLSLTKLFLVNLSQANLKNAKLNGAVFGGADLGDADLRGADLRGANLDGAYLGGALLEGKFVTATPYADAGVPDLQKEVYIADPAQPKKKPEKKDIQLAKTRIFSEPPPSPVVESDQSRQQTTHVQDPPLVDIAVLGQMNSMPKAPQLKTPMAMAPATINVKSKRDITTEREVVKKAKGRVAKSDSEGDHKALTHVIEIGPVSSEIIPKPLPTISKANLLSVIDEKKQRSLQILEKTNRCYACDLSGLDFSGKNFKNVDLERANLSDTNFEGAIMVGANLKDTNLQGANFKLAQLSQADFYKADLSGADFTGADISAAKFDNANMSTAIGLDSSSEHVKP